MTDETAAAKEIDDHIARFPEEVQAILQQVRQTIRAAAPQAQERISYQIPTFYLEGNLVHFAGYQCHVGFYPAASGIANFREALTGCKSAKGSVKFPLDRPIPYNLITRIVRFQVEENLARKKK